MPTRDGGVGVGAACPDGDGVLRGVAAEPDVAGGASVTGGTGLAGNRLIDGEGAGAARAAALHDGLEHVGHGLGFAGGEHLVVLVLVLVERGARARGDLGYGNGIAMLPARGEGRIGLCHLKRGDALCHGTQGKRENGRIHARGLGIDAKVLAHGDNLVIADSEGHLGVARVRGDRRCLCKGFGAVVGAAVVLHGVTIGDFHRRGAVERDIGVHTVVDGGGQREALKGRAHCAARGGMVDVAVVGVVVAAAYHGADITGLRLNDDHAHVELVGAGVNELLDGRILCCLLDRGVDGGLDGQAALEKHVGGELFLKQTAHVVDKVGVGDDARLADARNVEFELLGLGSIGLFLRDGSQAQHVVENLVATGEGTFGVHRGVEVGGRVGQAHEQRRFGERELAGMLGEVHFACGFDTVGAVPVVDCVEVHGEDLVFREDLLHLQGDPGLADLTLDGVVELFLRQNGVAHQLLGDGRRALGATGELA